MNADPIRLPFCAMALLTALVWVKLHADRLREMRAKGIAPQQLASERAAAGQLENTATAWACVALRALHSLIHVSFNRVVHRFLVYAASTLLLFGMWVAFFLRLSA